MKPETNGVSNGEQNGNHHVEQNGTSQENEKNELNHSDQENQKPKPHRAGNKKTRVSKKYIVFFLLKFEYLQRSYLAPNEGRKRI